jgi:hypothetical protein
MTHSNWMGEKYRTVEHVAPVSGPGLGWGPTIYQNPDTRHRLGNLVLLPERENQTIGKASWKMKHLFYETLASRSKDERERLMDHAASEGITFGRRANQLLKRQEHLNLLDSIVLVQEWNEETIAERTENLLGLAWDHISPWLFSD